MAAIALLAARSALGVLPKPMPEGVALVAPIYGHANIALVDEMMHSRVPPANPWRK